jgi:tetratricopeptide (TPR) repeat protein
MARFITVAGPLIILWSSWLSTSAAAQQGDYKALTEAAVEEHSLGHYEEARALFAKAHAISPNARTLWGMGTAAFEGRQYVDAMQLFDSALRDTRKPLTETQRKQAEALRKRAEDYVVRVEVDLEPKTARLSVDGREVERTASGALLLDAGMHQVVASADGYEEWVRAIRWAAGTASLKIKMQAQHKLIATERPVTTAPRPSDATDVSAAPARAPTALGVLKWAALGTTVAAVGIAAAGFGLREQAAREWNDERRCAEPMEQSCPDVRKSEKKWRTMGVAGGATAGVFAVLTAVFFVLDRHKPAETPRTSALCAPDGLGAVCALRF